LKITALFISTRNFVLTSSVDTASDRSKQILGCHLMRTKIPWIHRYAFPRRSGILFASARWYAMRHKSFLLVPKKDFYKTLLHTSTSYLGRSSVWRPKYCVCSVKFLFFIFVYFF
jgi:hypothetical protein